MDQGWFVIAATSIAIAAEYVDDGGPLVWTNTEWVWIECAREWSDGAFLDGGRRLTDNTDAEEYHVVAGFG